LILAEALVLAAVVILSVFTSLQRRNGTAVTNADQGVDVSENWIREDGTDVYQEGAIVFNDEVEAKLSAMTLEEMVSQMFLVTPEDLTGSEEVSLAGSLCQSAITAYPVGGILCDEGNFIGSESAADNLYNLQTYADQRIGVDLFLLVEDETASELSGQVSGIISRQQELGTENLTFLEGQASFDAAATEELRQQDVGTVLISGDLSLLSPEDIGGAAVKAVNAGMNLLYVSDGFAEAYAAVLEAVQQGQIDQTLIRNAAGRILRAKWSPAAVATEEAETDRETEDTAAAQQQIQQQTQPAENAPVAVTQPQQPAETPQPVETTQPAETPAVETPVEEPTTEPTPETPQPTDEPAAIDEEAL
jgi:hypothetical protein